MSADDYESDAPTRPDLPAFVAAVPCAHCGRVFSAHAEMFPIDVDAKCLGLRVNFAPVEIAP